MASIVCQMCEKRSFIVIKYNIIELIFTKNQHHNPFSKYLWKGNLMSNKIDFFLIMKGNIFILLYFQIVLFFC